MKLLALIFVFLATYWSNVDSSALPPTSKLFPRQTRFARDTQDVEDLKRLAEKRPFVLASAQFAKRPFIRANPKFDVVINDNDNTGWQQHKRPFIQSHPRFDKRPFLMVEPNFDYDDDDAGMYDPDLRNKRPFIRATPNFNGKDKRPFVRSIPEFDKN